MPFTIDPHDPAHEIEIALTVDKLTLYVSPWGASLRGLVFDGVTELITRYKGASKTGGEGDVLIPFPGRIAGGKYEFGSVSYQLDKNDHEGPNAIHGFLRNRPWAIVQQTAQTITFAIDLAKDDAVGYPFPLHVQLTYELSAEGINVGYTITNVGEIDAPVAAGFHPYFTVGTDIIDDTLLQLPFKSYLEYEALIPTGRIVEVVATPYDFLEPKLIATTVLNHCFLNPIRDNEGNVAITLRSPDAYRTIRVTFGPEIDYVVLYTGDVLPESHRRKALAIEPMTGASDSFNHPDWGLASVKPGQSLSGKWKVEIALSDWQGASNQDIIG